MKLAFSIILSFIFVAHSFSKNTDEWSPIGKLGVQLGTVVEVKGKIVDGNSLNCKSSQCLYLIEVSEVNNSVITNKLYMEFRHAPGTTIIDYPSDHFALYKRKTGKEPPKFKWSGTIPTIENMNIEALQTEYVGSSVHFLAWESGMFDGIPNNLPEGTPLWSDGSFGFRSWLVLLDDLTKKNSNQKLQPTVKTPVELGDVQGTAAEL